MDILHIRFTFSNWDNLNHCFCMAKQLVALVLLAPWINHVPFVRYVNLRSIALNDTWFIFGMVERDYAKIFLELIHKMCSYIGVVVHYLPLEYLACVLSILYCFISDTLSWLFLYEMLFRNPFYIYLYSKTRCICRQYAVCSQEA